jgi:hypothetical protein
VGGKVLFNGEAEELTEFKDVMVLGIGVYLLLGFH